MLKPHAYQCWLIAVLLTLLVGCQKKDADSPVPADDSCQLQTIIGVSQDGQRNQQTYAYSSQGLLLSITSSSTTVTGSVNVLTRRVYEYDNNGFLMSEKEQTTVNNTPNVTISEINYEYTNGKLTKMKNWDRLLNEQGQITTYTYDGAGKLASYTYENGPDDIYKYKTVFTFTNGVLSGGSHLDQGRVSSMTVVNGQLISESYIEGTSTNYTYDSQGYRIKEEGYSNLYGLTTTTTYEYSSVPVKSIFPTFKGMPVFSIYGKEDRPVIRSVIVSRFGTARSESTYTFQLNSKGYPIAETYKNTDSDGQNNSWTGTYRFTNCP